MAAPQHVASARVKIGGADVEMELVERIEVRNYMGLPDMATVKIADPEGREVQSQTHNIGDSVEISLGALEANAPSNVFKGEIVSYEFEFSTSSAFVSLRAYDKAHRLTRNRRSATFQDMTVADIVRKVLGENQLDAGQIAATSTVHPFVQQSMETDLDFVNRLAALENCEFGVADGRAFLQQQRNGAGTVPVLKWRENAHSFKPRVTAAQQHDKVRVVSYDPKTKEAVVGEATTPGAIPTVAQEVRRQGGTFGASELLVSDRVVNTADEARTLAQSLLDKLAGGSFEAEGVMHGDPRLKAGGKLKLEGFGQKFDGVHDCTAVTHVYGHGDYRTRFTIAGRNPRTLTDVMRPKTERDWTSGIVIGVVTNINDPEDLGRVRVQFPTLGDDIEGFWARMALPNAGPDSGMAFLPQVGDEVAVGFEHGDTRRPIVLGALHNGSDKPHSDMRGDQDGGSLVIKGRKDARIDLEKEFKISSKDKMEIKLDGDYKLDTNGKIEMKSGGTITIEGSGAVKLKSSAGIDVEATGQLNLKGMGVNVDGGAGVVTVKGSMINLG